MKKILNFLIFAFCLLLLAGCKKDLLDVKNLNQPDFAAVYASGTDLENLTSGLYSGFYQGSHAFDGPEMMLATAADMVSCSWGNQAMRDMSWEPRDHAWNNSPSYSYQITTYAYFNNMYSAINTASNVLKAIAGGTNVGAGGTGNNRVKAVAKFIQGISYGNLALVFDKAFIVDETKTVEGAVSSAVDFQQVSTAALGYLDEAIALSSNTFTIPAAWLGTSADMSNTEFKKLCNTYAARILSYTPRNKTQLAAVNWAKVKTYADAGITSDFNVVNDAYVKWYSEAGDYLNASGWGVTDMYVVNMMDPTKPAHWDDISTFPYPTPSTNPIDKRLNTDFEYLGSNWFQAARGYYHYSAYRCKRYDAFYVNAQGPKAEIFKAENDMLKAEARAYTTDLAGAALIINASTWTTRGQMPAVLPLLPDLVKAIQHERFVEMYTSGMGLQFFEMRKLNLLQKGTPLHLPLPAKTLETFGVPLPFYTFGSLSTPQDGINTSNAGWR